MFSLATKGMDSTAKYSVLKRHFSAFVRHMTIRKLFNFCAAEYNRMRKKTRLRSFPYILKVEPSNICNLKCAYCYDERRKPLEGERPYGRMGFADFKLLIDEIGRYLFKINLYGFGEPFLFPETLEMIKYASTNNIGIAVSSNLCIDDPDLARQIVESGLEVLIFSCHGVSDESYNKFMKKGNMELALSNVKAIITERNKLDSATPYIDWQYCVTGFNEGEIEMAKEKAEEIGVDQIRFIKPSFPDYAADEWYADLFKGQEEVVTAMEPACSWLYRSAYINHDGGLLPCCTQGTRILKDDFGNVFTEGFTKIWNNETYVNSRRLAASSSCGKDCKSICTKCYVPHS